jgi:hypothetical protein
MGVQFDTDNLRKSVPSRIVDISEDVDHIKQRRVFSPTFSNHERLSNGSKVNNWLGHPLKETSTNASTNQIGSKLVIGSDNFSRIRTPKNPMVQQVEELTQDTNEF